MIGYRLIYGLGLSLARLLSPLVPKLRVGFAARRGLETRIGCWRKALTRDPLWFHVASSGEFEQVLPVLEQLRRVRPGLPIFLSYFSPSGERAVRLEIERRGENPAPWNFADYCPLDRRREVERFLDALKPARLVLVHREIWPEMVRGCHRRSIPGSLISAFFPPQHRSRVRWYAKSMKLLSGIDTIDEGSAELLRSELGAGAPPIQCLGDPRVERALSRADATAAKKTSNRIWMAASVWPEDFNYLKPLFLRIARQPGWKIVLVPHEVHEDELRKYERFFASAGKTATRWSATSDPWQTSSPLIVDRIGFLAELYASSDAVFVGGSFRRRVHNVLEPAAHGRPILCGPHIGNSAEAVEMNRRSEGLLSVGNQTDLLLAAEQWLNSEPTRTHFGALGRAFLEARVGASRRYAERLFECGSHD